MALKQRVAIISAGLFFALFIFYVLLRLFPLLLISMLQIGMQSRMHCWVKVVNQNGRGIGGYKCRVVEEHAPFLFFWRGKDVVRIYETSDDGFFEYKSRGPTGRVFFGYDCPVQWRLNPRHLMQSHPLCVTSLEYQRSRREGARKIFGATRKTVDIAPGDREACQGYLGSRENPYIIRVWTVCAPHDVRYWKQVHTRSLIIDVPISPQEYDRAIEQWMKKGEVLSASGKLECYGIAPPWKLLYWKCPVILQDSTDYVCMDILSGKTWESEKPEGDVAMADGFGTAEHPAPCSVTIKAGPHCEVAPVLDDWGLGPPKDGYSKEICWPKSWEWPGKQWGVPGLWFYYRLERNGAPNVIYGKILLPIGRVNGGKIECFANLQGDRNLFYRGYVQSCDSLPGDIKEYVSPPVR